MHLLLRGFVILFAFGMACIAAGLVITLGFMLPEWRDVATTAAEQGTLGIVVGLTSFLVSGFAMIPAMIIILIAEGAAIRSILFYATAGAALALFCYYGLGLGFALDDRLATTGEGFFARAPELMAAAGIVAGFTYWLIAGRNAGRWRERHQPSF
jgi:hypothetical protein